MENGGVENGGLKHEKEEAENRVRDSESGRVENNGLENEKAAEVGNGVCDSELDNGSRDVRSCKESDASSADHLVVMVHGILGSATDWKYGAEQFVKQLPDKVIVHCSEKNISTLSLDGVDVMGERLVEEVLDVIKRTPGVRKISFISHSVGGLVARYAIGLLFRPYKKVDDKQLANDCEGDSGGTIGGLEPMNFITVSTPHLGSRGNKQVPFLFGWPPLENLASNVIHLIFRRTGRHLFLVDNDGKPPLLRRMIEDSSDCFFMSALRTFKRRVLYSNVAYDHIVGWRTSSIRRHSELPKWEECKCLNEKYPHVVYEEHCQVYDAEKCDSFPGEDDGCDKIEEELLKGLSHVPWEKVDVSFHMSRQRSAAHSVIQVKDESAHLDGADVIQHMIDHFLC